MIKKLIPISVILALAVSLGLVGVASAAGNDVVFTSATTTGVSDLVISAGSQVQSIVIGTATVIMTMASGSTITFTSAGGNRMVLDHPDVATGTCTATTNVSSIVIPYNATYPTVTLNLTGETCVATEAPIISAMVVTNTTTVTITFSRSIAYVTDSAGLIAVTTFAGKTPSSTSISGADLVLTFASGDLTDGAVKDDSKLILPTNQIRSLINAAKVFAGTTTQVITDLATINQLYDFVFMIQTGQNFMSIPYDITTTLANSYVTPATKTISIQTIDNAGGIFETVLLAGVPTPTSFDPLYGYYINSDAGDVYLRLKKTAAASQSLTFSRTFTAIGWHLIGVASNNVATAITLDTDDDVLSTVGSNYDKVVDIAIGRSGDTNANANPDYTYDATVPCYKALLDNAYIVAKTAAQIIALSSSGIEFNHGEAYFIWINALNAKYTGEKASGTATSGNLIKQLGFIRIE